MAKTNATFSDTYERNVFVLSILSEKYGPDKYLISTSTMMTPIEFKNQCKKYVTDYKKENTAKNIAQYICEKTGWLLSEFYNSHDFDYHINDS